MEKLRIRENTKRKHRDQFYKHYFIKQTKEIKTKECLDIKECNVYMLALTVLYVVYNNFDMKLYHVVTNQILISSQ